MTTGEYPEDRRAPGSLNLLHRAWIWTLAPLVEKWHGLSLSRFLAVYVAIVANDIAHDWIQKCVEKGTPLGWAFVGFVFGMMFLAAMLAFGAKHFDKFLEIVATKVGVALAKGDAVPAPPG